MSVQTNLQELQNDQELPPLPQEQEARIRAFVNMLLDVAEEKLRDNMEVHHV